MSEAAKDIFESEDEIEVELADTPAMGPDGGPIVDPADGAPASAPAEAEAEAESALEFGPEDYAPSGAQAHSAVPDDAALEAALAQNEDYAAEARIIPRIGIHAFCESDETVAVIQKAAQDRRLSKAHVAVDLGGVAAAVAHFQSTPTPDLVIVESFKRGQQLLEELDALAQVCDPTTKVVVIGHVNDIALYRELIRCGVSEYLVQPKSPLHLIHSIGALYADPAAPPIGRIISFMGAKGGVGASTLAHNIAWCVAEEMHSDTTVVDFDLPFGTTGLDFNQDPAQGVSEALSAPERLDDVLLERLMTRCSDHLSIFAAPATLERDLEHDETAYESVVEAARGVVPNVVIDLPHVWSAWTKRVLMASDQIALVATPDLASLRNVKNLYDLLKAARPNDPAPRLILNMVGAPKRPEIPVKAFAEAAGVKPALVLPWDAGLFGAAANNATTVLESNPKHRASQGLRHVAKALSGREFAAKAQRSLFARLFNRS